MADDTTLRDELARDRTVMSNERTFLSYTRTALGVVALALFIFKFAPPDYSIPLGAVILVVALGVLLIGVRNFRAVAARIGKAQYGFEAALDDD